jgi:hypothetical protein
MNTVSRSLGTRTSPSWLTPYGRLEAVRKDHQKKTGFMPREICVPEMKGPGMNARPDKIEFDKEATR